MIERQLFSPRHAEFRNHVARFLDEQVAPHYADWEQEGMVPREVWRKAGDAGLLCRTIPKDYGGPGDDFLSSVVVIEELSKRRFTGLMTYLHSDIVVPYLLCFGSETQKKKYLPLCSSGRLLTAVALTEPQSGSDIDAITTTVDIAEDVCRINGTKTHVSCGISADLVIVAARTKRDVGSQRGGISLLLVDAPRDGLQRVPIRKLGLRALDTATLNFSHCELPVSNVLGSVGMGFIYIMKMLAVERLILALAAQSAAVQILRETICDCRARRTRGGSILDFQNTRFVLAELISECEVNQAFVDRCITAYQLGGNQAQAACVAKLRTTEFLKRLTLQAMQLRGARGVTVAKTERASLDLLDACVQTVWGGTSEVIKNLIGENLARWA